MKKHPLRAWLDDRKERPAKFARRLGVSPQLLSDVFAGRCHLGRENSLAVVQATGGEVTLADLATWEAPAEPEAEGGEDHAPAA